MIGGREGKTSMGFKGFNLSFLERSFQLSTGNKLAPLFAFVVLVELYFRYLLFLRYQPGFF